MTEITAKMVKELRDKTGAGMLDCKKALNETDGDMDAALDWLRTKGIASAEKKAGRAAADGLVSLKTEGNQGVLVELNAETDFVARNEEFQSFLADLTQHALEHGVKDLETQEFRGKSVSEAVVSLTAKIGENINLRRATEIKVSNGVVGSYVHNAMIDGMGQIGVIVGIESESDNTETLENLGKQIAMHIAAAKPESLSVESLDQELVERERNVLIDQAKESGKPDNIIEKMIEGRMRKFYEQVVLNEQTYVIDGESKVSDVVEATAKELGSAVKITGFERYELGEGVEKKDENFADEVAAMAG